MLQPPLWCLEAEENVPDPMKPPTIMPELQVDLQSAFRRSRLFLHRFLYQAVWK